MIIDVKNGRGLEQLMHFPDREKKKNIGFLFIIFISLHGLFQDFHSPDKLTVVSGTLKVCTPSEKKGIIVPER